mmetsp:Transcript_5127/g.11645  ORF Transcript_5127/g.11645 Transcript_5127/m.11645 type:complete len:89 (-) Transcript_5127:247-513(-)
MSHQKKNHVFLADLLPRLFSAYLSDSQDVKLIIMIPRIIRSSNKFWKCISMQILGAPTPPCDGEVVDNIIMSISSCDATVRIERASNQ